MKQTSTIKLLIVSAFLIAGFVALLMPRRHSMESLLARIDREFPELPQITTDDLASRLENGQNIALFDVRTSEEYQASHLPNATLLEAGTPASSALRSIKRSADETTPVVLYCSVGYRAAQLADALRREGWTKAVVLRGSIFKWAKENRPLLAGAGVLPLVHPHSITYAHLLPPEKRAKLSGSTLVLNHFPRAERWRLGLGIGLLVFFLIWETLSAAFRWFKNPSARFAHGWRNYLLGFINVILAGLFFVQLWLLAARWADQHSFGLMHYLSLPAWLRIIIAVLLLDGWTYAWHRLNHQVPFLWRFHRTHHSEMHLDVTSAVRFHFGEITLSGLLRVPLILLLGLHFRELLVYETLLFATVQFQHANIRLPLYVEALLSRLIASPAFHRVHHSLDPLEFNSNYSSVFTFWDRLFRTGSQNLIAPGEPGRRFGVNGMDQKQTLVGLIESPME